MSILRTEIQEAVDRASSELGSTTHWDEIFLQLCEFLEERKVTSLSEVTDSDLLGFVSRPGPNGGRSRNTTGDRGSVVFWLFQDRPDLSIVPVEDVTVPIAGQPIRALTTPEMVDVQNAVFEGVASARLALAQTAMSSGEVCDVTVSALDDPDDPREVRWPDKDGEERVYRLTEWGRYEIKRQVREIGGDPAAFVAYDNNTKPGSFARRSAASKILRKTLDIAGLSSDPAIKPKSISYWGALECRERGESPETVARLLGVKAANLPRFMQ